MKIDVSFSVPHRYPVIFANSIFSAREACENKDALRFLEEIRPKTKDVLIDSGVIESRPDRLKLITQFFALEPLVLEGGESLKSDSSLVDNLHQRWIDKGIDRHSLILLIGGGSFLDATGFAASLFHRGVGHIRFPSTLLAQNDAGIGVKNGINRFGQKNLQGVFQPPVAVINDSEFLSSLTDRDFFSGYAEAIKVALIRDQEFFYWIESNNEQLLARDSTASRKLIEDCARLHLAQISKGGDPFETGSARPLDFGHWLAHRLEILTAHELRHGEAVSIGIAVDSALSCVKNMISQEELAQIVGLLQKLKLPAFHSLLAVVETADGKALHSLCSGLEDFRQHLGGELCIELLSSIGHGHSVNKVEKSEVFSAIQLLKRLL